MHFNKSSLVPHPQLKLVNKFGNLNSIILYINMANFPKAVEGCWGRGLLDDVKWKN